MGQVDGPRQLELIQQVGPERVVRQITITKDTAPPQVSFTSPAENTEDATGLTIIGRCEGGEGDVTISGSGVSASTPATCSGSGQNAQFSQAITFSDGDGPKQVQISQTDRAGNTGSATRTFVRSAIPADQLRFQAAQNVIVQYCMNCHGAWRNNTEQDYIDLGLVIPGDLAASTLNRRLKYSDGNPTTPQSGIASDMPFFGTAQYNDFSIDDYNAIANWISQMESSTPPAPEPGEQSRLQAPRLANRVYLDAVFEDIFGVNTVTYRDSGETEDSFIYRNIQSRAEIMGGPCDRWATGYYSPSNNPWDKRADLPKETCIQRANAALGMVPTQSVIREGWIINTCEILLENNSGAGLDHAINRIFNGTGMQNPNAQTLQTAYQLFYPAQPLPTNVRTALQTVADGVSSTRDKWKWVILSICMSPGWQVP